MQPSYPMGCFCFLEGPGMNLDYLTLISLGAALQCEQPSQPTRLLRVSGPARHVTEVLFIGKRSKSLCGELGAVIRYKFLRNAMSRKNGFQLVETFSTARNICSSSQPQSDTVHSQA